MGLAENPIKAVSQRAGHANVSITLNTYTHVLPDSQEKMIAADGDALEAALERVKNGR